MSLSGVAVRLTAAERAREPRTLGLVAYYDGHARGSQGPTARPTEYPRRLTRDEAEWWRDGFTEGRAERARLDAHGFASCESVGCDGVHR